MIPIKEKNPVTVGVKSKLSLGYMVTAAILVISGVVAMSTFALVGVVSLKRLSAPVNVLGNLSVNIPAINMPSVNLNNTCYVNNSNSGWVLLGPSDGKTYSLEYTDNQELYVATSSGGIFRSFDQGNSWDFFSNGLESSKSFLLKIIEGKLYVTAGSGVYVLEGSTWGKILEVDGLRFYHIDYDRANNRLWALADLGIYYSDDFGISWVPVESEVFDNSGYLILFVTQNNEIFVSTRDNLYKNLDQADQWVQVFDQGLQADETKSSHPFTEDEEGNLYVVARDGFIYNKEFGQENFVKKDQFGIIERGSLIYFDNRFFYETGWGGLVIADKEGNEITKIESENVGLLGDGFWDIRQFYLIPDKNKILMAHDNGVSELDLMTETIKKFSPIPKYSEVTSLTKVGDKNALVVTYWDHSSLISDDCGANWKQSFDWEGDYLFGDTQSDKYIVKGNGTLTLRNLEADYLWGIDCPGSQYVSSLSLDDSTETSRAYVICKKDGWSNLTSFFVVDDYSNAALSENDLPDPYIYSIAVDSTNSKRLISVANDAVYETLNQGKSWDKIIDRPEGGFWESLAINPFNTQEIIIGGYDGNIFMVKNGELNEVNIFSENSGAKGFVNTIVYDDKTPNIIYAGVSNGFYYSQDNGQTWLEFNEGLRSRDIRKIISKNKKIFVGTWGSGVAIIAKKSLGLD